MAIPHETAEDASRIIVTVKLVALILAVATAFVTYTHQFEWYTALITGVLAYVLAKPVGGLVVGYFLGREDARNVERLMKSAGPSWPEIKQELIDNAPSGTNERVANLLNRVETLKEASAAQEGLTAAFKTRGHNFMTMESSVHEALVKDAMATGVEETMKHFDRKAQFEKLLQELKVLVFTQSAGFAAGVAEEIEALAAKGSSFSSLPRAAYERFFSSVAPPKSDKTLINQMTLFLGAFSFYWHAIDRYSFRKDNETLRVAILDPIVFAISKGLAEIMTSKGRKATTEEVIAAVQPLSLRYAGARTLLGSNPNDFNSVYGSDCAARLAARAIVDDTELALDAGKKLTLSHIVMTVLLESILKLELPKRIKTLETLL